MPRTLSLTAILVTALAALLLMPPGRGAAQTAGARFDPEPVYGAGRFTFTDVETGALWLVDGPGGTASVVTSFTGNLDQLRAAAAAYAPTSLWVGTTGWQRVTATSAFPVTSPLMVMLIRGPIVPATGGAPAAPAAPADVNLAVGLAAPGACPTLLAPVPTVSTDGTPPLEVCATVRTRLGAPMAGQLLLVTVSLGGLGAGEAKSSTLETDASGKAAIAYRAGTKPGVDTIVVSHLTIPGPAAQISVTVAAPAPAPAPTPTPAPTGTPAPSSTPAPARTPSGTFAASPRFDATGSAITVFDGGSVEALGAAAAAAGARGAWIQDASGAFRLLVVDGPAFLVEQFRSAFPDGVPRATAVALNR